MSLRLCNAVVLVAATGLWLASGTQRERAVLGSGANGELRDLEALEADAAAHPDDSARVRGLAQAYLDHHVPGLAVAAVERAGAAVRGDPRVDHVYARALLEEGHAEGALAAERRVLATCTIAESICDTWLTASAMRRADILREMVHLGVEDALAEPEASALAYTNATREARLAIR